MTDADYQARLNAFAGVETGETVEGPDEVNAAMIRHWCDAIGDANPVYTDPDAAAASVHGGLVAPPTMLQAWVMRRLADGAYVPTADGDGPYEQLTATLAEGGFTSVVATNCEQTYERYLRPGDRVSMRTTIEGVSGEKRTALGEGHFVTTRQDYLDGEGELVGSMLFRIFRFRPPAATDEATAERWPRPAPATTPDNQWWFDALDDGRLVVQRCDTCGAVRHPPGPMCPICRSLDWSPVDTARAGVVHSYVRVHHPQVPAFDYPLDVLLVDIDVPGAGATVRMLMNRADAGPTAIGEHVDIELHDVVLDLDVDRAHRLPIAVATNRAPGGDG